MNFRTLLIVGAWMVVFAPVSHAAIDVINSNAPPAIATNREPVLK